MSRLSLTFACGHYDRTEALRTGIVRPEGIDLNYLAIEAPREIFDRMVGGLEFEVSELSASEYICLTGAGKSQFVALPVFPSRAFRHSFIYINKKAGIRSPKDLEGKRVGVALYTQTAAIYIRGHLAQQYGVDLSKIHWVQGAVEQAGTHGKPHSLPVLKPVDLVQSDSPHSLGDLLASGEIDALIGSRRPLTLGVHPDVARLFPDFREIERDFYQQTKIFPIMHLVAIRKDVYEAHPWVANSLYKAFVEAKNWSLARMHFSGSTSTMMPWHAAAVDEIDEIFGGDPWPYGVEPNRPTLDAFMKMLVEQDFIERPIPIDDLFVPLPGAMGY
jgi:4,5-dihydroxyphthalate decarboxylase